jgi:hypothetical protein
LARAVREVDRAVGRDGERVDRTYLALGSDDAVFASSDAGAGDRLDGVGDGVDGQGKRI